MPIKIQIKPIVTEKFGLLDVGDAFRIQNDFNTVWIVTYPSKTIGSRDDKPVKFNCIEVQGGAVEWLEDAEEVIPVEGTLTID